MQHSNCNGFAPDEANTVPQLDWQAFGVKLHVQTGPADKALAFTAKALNPDFTLAPQQRLQRSFRRDRLRKPIMAP